MIGIGALVVVLGGILVFLTMRGSDSSFAQQLQEAEANFPFDLTDGTAVGNADAPITLVSYIDYRCPFCMRFAAEDEPTIIEEYVTQGIVRIETKHMPVLGDESVMAAEAAQCAARQDAKWSMHHRLFVQQANEGTGTGRFSTDNLKRFARDIGLDSSEFNECLDSRATNNEVQDHRAEAQSYGFTGTPSFLINGAPLTGAPANMDGWRTIFEQVLEDLEANGNDGDDPANGEANGDAGGDNGQ
jgi:protein-disulfide isomerase